MEDDEHFQELKEKEIIRLTTPLTYVKEKWYNTTSVYDCEGNKIIERDDGKYILEPNPEILSHDEILMYAPRSKEASRVRLRQGKGKLSDKYKLYGGQALLSTGIPFMFCWVAIFSFWLFLLLIIIHIITIIYIFFIHDFKDKNLNKTSKYNVDEQKISNNNELSMLFESKEKIARKMIERKFPAPQMTNTKFNAVIDECKKEVESQVSILNALTPTTKTKHEIASRKKLIKQLISKIDDLTNELILFEENNIEDIIDSMDELINSVKNYK